MRIVGCAKNAEKLQKNGMFSNSKSSFFAKHSKKSQLSYVYTFETAIARAG